MKNLFLILVFVCINSSVHAQFIDNSKNQSLMGTHVNNEPRKTTFIAGIMSPPSTIVALNGYNNSIPLAWKSPGSGDVLGYNIYRSVSAGGTYTKIDSNVQRQYYRDETAKNGVTFYYKITTVYSTGESDYSSTVNAMAEADGYTIFSGWTTTAPTLDGVINNSEWSQAVTTNVTYPGESGSVTLYTMNNDTHLFLAVEDKRDNSLDNFDGIGIFCDANLDREWPSSSPSSEGIIQQFWNSGASNNSYQGFYGYWPNNYGGDAWTTPSGVNQSISLASGYVNYEASFDLTSSPVKGSPGDIIGIMLYVYDAGQSGFDGAWPQATTELASIIKGNGWAHAPFSYGDIKLAQESQVSFWADVDSDGDVDITDVQLVAAHWNLHVYDANYNSKYDVNNDELIDIVDIQMVAYWWNKPIPSGGERNKSVTLHSSPEISAQDLTIRVKPQQLALKIGDVSSVDVGIENVNNLGAFQFSLVYNSDVVHADTAFMGNFLANTGRTIVAVGPEIDNTNHSGKLTFGGATFGSNTGPDGKGVLATVEFNAQGAGSTTVELQNIKVADINGQTIMIDSLIDGEIVVSPHKVNLLTNGDFSDGDTGWILRVHELATASGAVQDGEYAVSINNGSNVNWHVQLVQNELLIENGKTYSVSFEAYAASPRQIHSYVRRDSEPYTLYSDYQTFSLTTSKQKYSYTFKMNEPTDHVAALTFELGNSTVDVFFDNITLTEVAGPTTVEDESIEPANLPTSFSLLQNYPNPFNPETTIAYQLPQSAEVTITIYDLQGHEVRKLDYGERSAGRHAVKWNGRNQKGLKVTSGIYFYRIQMKTKEAGQRPFVAVKKMIMIK